MARLIIRITNLTARLDISASIYSIDSLIVKSNQYTNPSKPSLTAFTRPTFFFFFFAAWGAGSRYYEDKGRYSDQTKGSEAESACEEPLGISCRRSARTTCSPLASLAGNGRGRTSTMYGKGLMPSSRRFFIDRRSSWFFSLFVIYSSRLM